MRHYLDHLEESIRINWNFPALSNYQGETFSYKDLACEIAKMHLLFEKCGINKGDKITLCAKNSARWSIAYFSILSYEAVVVPLLNDFLPENIQNLTDHSDSVLLFTESSIWNRIDPEKTPKLLGVINVANFSTLFERDEIITKASASIQEEWDKLYPNGLRPQDVHYPYTDFERLALISYTSGTTSAPKGVMLSAKNISSNLEFAKWGIPAKPQETLVSMLPLAHLFGLAFELQYPIMSGCHVFFLGKVPTPKLLLKALSEVKPYMMVTVPLVMEKIFKNKVLPMVNKPFMKVLLNIPGIRQLILASIRKKLLSAFGGNVGNIPIGGAAINVVVEKWMKAIKVPYCIGYGMTECAPLIGYEDWKKFKMRSCGKVVHRMEIRIDSENARKIVGEIQVKGDNVMMGYYKNPEATKATFTEDGWLKTGDLGLIDREGNIFIKGRSKNMILSANGQNIYPEEIEDKINDLPWVLESIVVDRSKKLYALVVPDYEKAKEAGLNKDMLVKIMDENRSLLNEKLPSYSRITKMILRDEPFEKTPKKSIKRFMYN